MFTMLNENCFNVISHMPDNCMDIVFTSPPYNRKRNDKYNNYNDNNTNYFEFITTLTDECLRVSKRHVFMNIQSNYYNKRDVYRFMGRYCNTIQQVIIWEKSNPMPANGNNITNAFEYFFVLGNETLKSNTTYTKNIITTSVNSKSTHKTHKAVMKQEVADWFIENFTISTDKVFDPMAGLGTTGIACVKYGREFLGVEIDKEYYEIARKRLEESKCEVEY